MSMFVPNEQDNFNYLGLVNLSRFKQRKFFLLESDDDINFYIDLPKKKKKVVFAMDTTWGMSYINLQLGVKSTSCHYYGQLLLITA